MSSASKSAAAEYRPLEVPATVPIVATGTASEKSPITGDELEWCFRRCTFSAEEADLSRHYGSDDAEAMLAALTGVLELYRPLLSWPGVGTRWREFAAFLQSSAFAPASVANGGCEATAAQQEAERRRCFVAFANHLGRVATYRALALDAEGARAIDAADEIFPTGQLRGATPAELDAIIRGKGVRQVLVARLFIAHLRRLLGVDPSISLHDDWQTTAVIASGYLAPAAANAPPVGGARSVYLYRVAVPVIESCGWSLQRVAKEAPEFLGPRYADHAPWFNFKAPAAPDGVWFDATVQRTERYGLYTVPHLRQRLMAVWRFDTADAVREAVAPFVEMQNALHDAHPNGEGAA
uniref:Uncharacterized protein n=1 Tax=Neobodo designis TaxID=312471 RepID=A0A7S1KWJ5_NEODS